MPKPRLAVIKLSSCDGCQLAILRLEEELFDLLDHVEIAVFHEATSRALPPPYDIAIVEGSVTTPEEAEQVIALRREAKTLIAVGACAVSGGIQALRNWASVDEYRRSIYAHPEYVEALEHSTAVSEHVLVDYELSGCPVTREQMRELLSSLVMGRVPQTPLYALCIDCKRLGLPCVLVTKGLPCLGPITRTGCGALCPSFDRACYGCSGPAEICRAETLLHRFQDLGIQSPQLLRLVRGMSGWSPPLRAASEKFERRPS